MNKYLIIIIATILLLSYNYFYVFTENFADTEQSFGGVDDNNSINTLAQIARKLLDGGATVPGNLTIKGDLVSSGSLTSASFITAGITSAGISASGDIITKGSITSTGNITTNGIINSGFDKWNISNDGKNRTYYGKDAASYYGSANGAHHFRTGPNGNGPDGMILDQNANLKLDGVFTLGGGTMNTYKGRWWKHVNGVDFTGGDINDFNCGSLNEGIQSCCDRFPHTMAVGFNGNHCWCKNHHAGAQRKDNWTSVLII